MDVDLFLPIWQKGRQQPFFSIFSSQEAPFPPHLSAVQSAKFN